MFRPFEVEDCVPDHGRDIPLEEMQGPGNQNFVGLRVNPEPHNLVLVRLFFRLHVATLALC